MNINFIVDKEKERVIVSNEEGKLEVREYQDNIEEVFILENIVEGLENNFNLLNQKQEENDKTYWDNDDNDDSAYYTHHLATKIGYTGIGTKILNFIEKLAKENSKKYIRLDCKKSNAKLNQCYQKQGFIYKGSGEEPYSHNLWEKEIM